MDPYTLAYLAGDRFFYDRSTVHPQAHTVLKAIERARTGQGGTVLGTLAKRQSTIRKPQLAYFN